jgi:hypothetical protein
LCEIVAAVAGVARVYRDRRECRAPQLDLEIRGFRKLLLFPRRVGPSMVRTIDPRLQRHRLVTAPPWRTIPVHLVALRFVGTVDSYSVNVLRNGEIETTTVTNGPFYVFEAPWDYTPGNQYGDVGPTLVHLRTHELHYLEKEHDRTVVHVDGAGTLDDWKWVFDNDDSDDY